MFVHTIEKGVEAQDSIRPGLVVSDNHPEFNFGKMPELPSAGLSDFSHWET